MKYPFKAFTINAAIAVFMALPSCKKQDVSTTSTDATIQAAALNLQAIAIAASSTSAGDSLYAVNTCPVRGHRDSISFGLLPSEIALYLSTNYAGYTFHKAFSILDQNGVLQGYGLIIQFNGNPIGLKFDLNGNFIQIFEQREGHDLLGHNWHEGGCFEDRDGKQRDTIAFSSLPANVINYFTIKCPSDTLLRASMTRTGGYVLLSRNSYLFVTTFLTNRAFLNRMQLPSHEGRGTPIDQNALPVNVLTYLSATFPGYVFNKAFLINLNGSIQGYCVVIDANNTKYAIQFDSVGNYVKTKVIL